MRKALHTAGCLLFLATPVYGQEFTPFSGYWRGVTHGVVADGKTERLTCTTNNAVTGARMKIMLRCAGTAVAIQIHAQFTHAAGTLSGVWEERQYNVAGSVVGSLTGTALNAVVSSPNFDARVIVRREGKALHVTVAPRKGTGAFSVTMHQ